MEKVQPGTILSNLLVSCEQQGATDLHALEGKPYTLRVNGNLLRLPVDVFPPPSEAELFGLADEAFSADLCRRIRGQSEVDCSFYHGSLRYRANFSRQMGQPSFAFRTVPQHRLKLRDLQLPGSLLEIIQEPRGLVLVTGPTGQGKSTTLRALIQEINETQAVRIITIEDPIEYVFTDALAQFQQREVGIDTASFADGIRNAMRQDPNVIFVGEIRDKESIFAAMQAAETGHFVLTTLHADSVAQAIARIRDYYPAEEHANITGLLARNINAIVCQRLIPNVQGSRTPCFEMLRRDRGVQEAIQSNNLTLLAGIVEAAVHQGMHSFDQYLVELLATGIINEKTVMHYAVNRHRLEMVLRGIVTTTPILRPDELR